MGKLIILGLAIVFLIFILETAVFIAVGFAFVGFFGYKLVWYWAGPGKHTADKRHWWGGKPKPPKY